MSRSFNPQKNRTVGLHGTSTIGEETRLEFSERDASEGGWDFLRTEKTHPSRV